MRGEVVEKAYCIFFVAETRVTLVLRESYYFMNGENVILLDVVHLDSKELTRPDVTFILLHTHCVQLLQLFLGQKYRASTVPKELGDFRLDDSYGVFNSFNDVNVLDKF